MNSAVRNDEAPTGQGQGFQEQSKSNSDHSDAVRDIDQADKDLATTRALLAFAGWTLHELSNCAGGTSFVAARLATSRVLPDRHALRQFARLVGSTH
jgi:hypothetical protein